MPVLNIAHLTEPMLILRGKLLPPGRPDGQVEVVIGEESVDLFDGASRAGLEIFVTPLTLSEAVDAVEAIGGSEEDLRNLVAEGVLLTLAPGGLPALVEAVSGWRVVVTAPAWEDSPPGTVTLDAGGGYGVRVDAVSAAVIARAMNHEPLGTAVPVIASELDVPEVGIWEELLLDVTSLLNGGVAFVTTD